jgi:4-diphosphocytidyl-2-C-methyl-D-erythritol kinase
VSARGRARVTIEARAKLNLGLAVGPRRADGYHDVATFLQSVSLADTLRIERRRAGFTLAVRHERAAVGGAGEAGRASVPRGRDNLVLRAARLLAARTGLEGGAHFRLVKRIPSRAGLGGGSADAAAAITGLARLYEVDLTRARRIELAAALGSDVPFAITGGTALATGRGEVLKRLRLSRPFRALIALPAWRVSTAGAYAALDRRRKGLTRFGAHLRSAQVLGRERLSAARALRIGNDFETVLGGRTRAFEALRGRLRDAGATGVRMTGSGSAVAGLLPSGRTAVSALRSFDGTEALFLVRSMGRGLKLIESS